MLLVVLVVDCFAAVVVSVMVLLLRLVDCGPV